MISKKIKEYFKGMQVNILSRSIKGTMQNEGGVFSGNQIMSGIWVDDDRCFIFLADSSGQVIDAVHKKDIVRIFLSSDDMFEAINENDIN